MHASQKQFHLLHLHTFAIIYTDSIIYNNSLAKLHFQQYIRNSGEKKTELLFYYDDDHKDYF